jgi:dihydropteroate synthase
LTKGWRCRDRELPVFDRVHVMGILNVTPDSFSDGGLFLDRDAAVKHGIEMVQDGAEILDVGGESTRPGAEPVSLAEELDRAVPVIQGLVKEVNAAISIDTTKAEVAEAALEAGAIIINDVSAMSFDPGMAEVVATFDAGLILMHMLGEPRSMQKDPKYDDVVAEVSGALADWAGEAEASGISREQIALDPGIGFGKTKEHNLQLLKHLDRLVALRHPILVGPSRKSFIGMTLDVEVGERLEGTAAAVAWCVFAGANVVRVHDVKQMTRVVRMAEAIRNA